MRVVCASFLVACVFFVPAAHAAKQEVLPLPLAAEQVVELRLVQQEMDVDVADSGAGIMAATGGGLLGALIGTAVNKAAVSNAEERVAALRDMMVGYDFNARFQSVLRNDFSPHMSPSPRFFVENSELLASDATRPTGVPGDGILVITPKYLMSQDFETLKVSVRVMYANRTLDKKGRLQQKPRFTRTYAWNYRLPMLEGSGATEDAARWTQVGKEKLTAMVDNGIVQTVALINYDFSPEGRDEAALSTKGRTFAGGSYIQGRKVRDQANGVVVRSGSGLFHALNGHMLTTDDVPSVRITVAAGPSAVIAAAAGAGSDSVPSASSSSPAPAQEAPSSMQAPVSEVGASTEILPESP